MLIVLTVVTIGRRSSLENEANVSHCLLLLLLSVDTYLKVGLEFRKWRLCSPKMVTVRIMRWAQTDCSVPRDCCAELAIFFNICSTAFCHFPSAEVTIGSCPVKLNSQLEAEVSLLSRDFLSETSLWEIYAGSADRPVFYIQQYFRIQTTCSAHVCEVPNIGVFSWNITEQVNGVYC